MEKLLLTLVTLVLVSTCSSQSSSCNDYPCPKYEVVETNEDFEVRRYVETDWITTTMSSIDGSSPMTAVNTLRAFSDKQKEDGHEFIVGWPEMITVKDGQTPSISLSWFLAPNSEPKISDTSVRVEHKPATTVYVRSYSGIPSLTAGEENKKILSDALTKAGKMFIPDIHVGALYESFLAFTHHNEIWLYSA